MKALPSEPTTAAIGPSLGMSLVGMLGRGTYPFRPSRCSPGIPPGTRRGSESILLLRALGLRGSARRRMACAEAARRTIGSQPEVAALGVAESGIGSTRGIALGHRQRGKTAHWIVEAM